MKIIENYPETLDKKTAFKMTEEEAIKLTECEGQELQVDAYVLYEDVNSKGEEVTLLSILSDNKVYATISNTFIDKFMKIANAFKEEGFSIEVVGGTSKAGRHYISCKVV